jgi:integrase
MKDIVVFAVSTMMRLGEILNLSWDSVNLDRRTMLVHSTVACRTKNGRPRVISMNDRVYELLAGMKDRCGYVFRTARGKRFSSDFVSKTFKKAVGSAGLPDHFQFHSLRQTGASWLIQSGVQVFTAQRLLGHSAST